MLAATQTTASLLSNAFYYFAKHPEIYDKVKREVGEIVEPIINSTQGASTEKWVEAMD